MSRLCCEVDQKKTDGGVVIDCRYAVEEQADHGIPPRQRYIGLPTPIMIIEKRGQAVVQVQSCNRSLEVWLLCDLEVKLFVWHQHSQWLDNARTRP